MRRAKSTTPATEKDERYWEKRRRNNIAAKKSRDNKRQFENSVRYQVLALEKENLLLRRELTLLRSRFGIPESQSVLSTEDHEECIKLAEEMQQSAARNLGSLSSGLPSPQRNDCVKDELLDKYLRLGSDTMGRPTQDTFCIGYDQSQFGAHARTSRNSHQVDDKDVKTLIDADILMSSHLLSKLPRKINSGQGPLESPDGYEVTDLSMKRRKLSVDDGDTNDCLPGSIWKEDKEGVLIRKQSKEEGVDKTKAQVNDDLKCKLEALSEQVQSMYKIIYSSD